MISHDFSLSRPLRQLLIVIVSHTFLVFDDLDSFEEHWSVFCRMSLSWYLSNFFLIFILGLSVLERMNTLVIAFFHIISRGTYHQHAINADINLDLLAEVVCVRLLHCKITFSFFSYYTLCKEVTMYGSYLRSGELCSTSLKAEYLYKLFVILVQGDFSLLLHLFIQLFIYISMGSWIFILYFVLQYSTLFFFFFSLKLFQLWPLGTLHLIPVSFWHTLTFFFLKHFFTFWHYKMI